MTTMDVDCRAGCGVPLDAVLHAQGVHPWCVPPPESELPRLEQALTRHQLGSARSLQTHLGPSEIGEPCERKLAYKLFGVPPVRSEGLKWAAQVGTWCHTGLEEIYREENARLGRERYLTERRVPVAPELGIFGSCDLYDMGPPEIVTDFKLPGKSTLDEYRRHGPSDVYRTQVHLYGRGFENLGFQPAMVRILFLPRASHLFTDAYEWTEPYDRSIADQALVRLLRIVQAGANLSADPATWEQIPADTASCRFCPWHQPLATRASGQGCPGEGPSTATSTALDGIVNR